jgi:hypothetical protein
VRTVPPQRVAGAPPARRVSTAAAGQRGTRVAFKIGRTTLAVTTRVAPGVSAQVVGVRVRSLPAEGGPVSGRLAVERAAERRVRDGVWRLPQFASHGDARLFRQRVAVLQLMDILPYAQLEKGVLGAQALLDVPEAGDRRRLVERRLAARAGPTGAGAKDAAKAWRLLEEAARARGRTHVLPVSHAVAATVVQAEADRAARAAKGSRGGATCAERVRKGLLYLHRACRLDIDAEDELVEEVARPQDSGQQACPRSHAASLPLCVQLQLETLANGPAESVPRFLARSFIVSAFAHNTRINDALSAQVWADESSPWVIRGRTTVRSKDGLPLELFAPAEGYLGRFQWWPAHAAALAGRRHVIPNFDASAPSAASKILSGVLPQGKAITALQDLMAMAPLRMPFSEWRHLGLKGHSIHGSGADLIRFLGADCGFREGDARAVGHWLRDRNAPAPGGRERPNAARGHGRPAGVANEREHMERRYSQGAGRRGEEAEQLRIRCRLVQVVREGLARFGRHWVQLPRSLESWDVLLPGAGAHLGANDADVASAEQA